MSASHTERIDTDGIIDPPSLARFLDELETLIEAIGVEYGLCHWGIYTGEPSGDLNEIEARRAEVLLDPAYRDVVRRFRGRAEDSGLERRLELLGRWFDDATIACDEGVYSLRNSINERIVGFKPKVGGQEISFAERSRILMKVDDRDSRREAYLAMRPLDDSVRADLLELVARRNARASLLGDDDFSAFALRHSSIDRKEILSLFDEIETATRDDHRRLLESAAEDLGVERLEPWDVRYAVERVVALPDKHFPKDGIVPKVESLFASLGIDLSALGIDLVIRDIPFGGLCFGIRIPDDVRILANPKDGHRDYEVLFHEFGHAVHDKLIDQQSPVLREGVEGCYHEAMAEVFGAVASDPDWLKAETDVPAPEVDAYAARKKNAVLVRLRSLAALAVFEFGLYDDPGRDADALWRETQGRYTGVADRGETVWASVSLLTTHPVYFQNYVLASAIAAQITDAIRTRFGRFPGAPRAAEFLRQSCYAPGASLDWPDKLERATGAPLSGEALLRTLTN